MDDEGIKMQRITILKISFLLRSLGNYIFKVLYKI